MARVMPITEEEIGEHFRRFYAERGFLVIGSSTQSKIGHVFDRTAVKPSFMKDSIWRITGTATMQDIRDQFSIAPERDLSAFVGKRPWLYRIEAMD